jgi:ribonuclease Z
MGLPVGAWLSELKRMIRDQASSDTLLTINGREYPLSDLITVAMITSGQKVSYITDISPDENNLNKVAELVRDSDTLYCEAYFLHGDLERAFERHHLTAKITGEIARKSKVKNLVLMHFSPKYFDHPDAIETEAMGEYRAPQE